MVSTWIPGWLQQWHGTITVSWQIPLLLVNKPHMAVWVWYAPVRVGIMENGRVLGFHSWCFICKFKSTFVVITGFLCWEIYISVFINQFLIFLMYYDIYSWNLHRDQIIRDKEAAVLLYFPLTFLYKNAVVYSFTTVSYISLCRTWKHFGSDATGSDCAM